MVSWPSELARFAVHAAVAAVLVWILLGPARPFVARFVARVGAMSGGRSIVLAVGLTLATRLALMPVVHPVYSADIMEYCEKAAAIATDGNPRAQETKPDGTHFYRTLGYSLPLAGWYRVTGMPDTPAGRMRSAQWFNIAAACAVAALLIALGTAVGRATAGRVAALVYATFLPAIIFTLLPYAETYATLLFVASVYVFAKLRDASFTRVFTLGAAFALLQGLLFITRTEFAWMPLLAVVVFVRDRGVGAIVPLLFTAWFFFIPFAVNHEMRDGYPGHLRTSVQGGLILYFGNNPIEVNGDGNATPEVVKRKEELYRIDPTGGLAADEAVAWIKEHPLTAVANAPKKLYHLWFAEPQGFTWHVAAGRDPGTNGVLAGVLRHAAWAQALCLLALGVVGLTRRGAPFAFWAAVVALHAATWCALAASTRNRYPLEPLLMIAAAAWISRPRDETAP
jgi:hypothetical protein